MGSMGLRHTFFFFGGIWGAKFQPIMSIYLTILVKYLALINELNEMNIF